MSTETKSIGMMAQFRSFVDPLIIMLAPGGEAMIPLARALIGGMLVSTLLTLFLVPCVYTLVKRDRPQVAA